MLITKIECIDKKKSKVYIDEEFAFVLYKGEIYRYSIKENEEILDSLYEKIKNEIIIKRAKLRAMHLLNDMDRTESALRLKLKQNFYTEDVIDIALDYVKSFGYIDDYRYAMNLIDAKHQSKSRKELYSYLLQKGVATEVIEEALLQFDQDHDDKEAIHKLILKKKFDVCTSDSVQLSKIYGFLARKGFGYDDIRQVVQELNLKA